jgi:hypothetical protein
MRQVYVQTPNAHGSWVTLLDAFGKRIEYVLTRALLRQMRDMRRNVRLVYVDNGRPATSRVGLDYFVINATEPAKPSPRPVVRKPGTGVPARVAKWKRTGHIKSWYAGIVMR